MAYFGIEAAYVPDHYEVMRMVRSIVEFANSCGMSTCLEGVETEELQNYLRLYQATWFQGYFYSMPVEIGKLREMVQG